MGSRFFRHGELHLVILVLLSGRGRNGYELMSELARLFGPAYRPSPGSVYPAVKALAAEGLLAPEVDGDRTRYTATPAGERAVAERGEDLARLEDRTGVRLTGADPLDAALDRLTVRVRAAAQRVPTERLLGALDETSAAVERLAAEADDHAVVAQAHSTSRPEGSTDHG